MNSLKVKHKMSTAFHPQTDGQTEQYNAELEAYLHIFCAYEPDTWNKMLPIAQFVHNSCTHEALKQSPFQLMYGTLPVALPLVSNKTNIPSANNRIDSLFRTREEALTAHGLLQSRYGLPHYAYLTRRTSHFPLCLPYSSLTLCLIRTDNLTSLLIPFLVRYLCSIYDSFLITNTVVSLVH